MLKNIMIVGKDLSVIIRLCALMLINSMRSKKEYHIFIKWHLEEGIWAVVSVVVMFHTYFNNISINEPWIAVIKIALYPLIVVLIINTLVAVCKFLYRRRKGESYGN